MNATSIFKSVEAVTAKWTKQRKQEERGRAQPRQSALTRRYRISINGAAWKVLPEAYLKASDGGRLTVTARQVYYAARGPIMEMTGRPQIDSQYFCQRILPDYLARYPEKTQTWDVTYDARGHFAEPHTGTITPLGTLDVRRYVADVRKHGIEPLDADRFLTRRMTRFPTCGPEHRFGAVLFIEKEGFMPLFEKVSLAERYDLAIMSTKGMPVVACRRLADELCGQRRIPLLVLHDFDKAGFSIQGTLAGVNHLDENYNVRATRYDYCHVFDVIDLGLRLPDVRAYNLESEAVRYKSDPSENLEENGATPEEIKFLCGDCAWHNQSGQRVELNAFTSGDFIQWIEAKLREHGIEKVIPDAETLEVAYRRAVQIELARDQLEAIIQNAAEQAEQAALPKNLAGIVRKALKADPTQPWDEVVAATAAAHCRKHHTGNSDSACSKDRAE